MDWQAQARGIIDDRKAPSASELQEIANALRDEGHTGLVGEMLTAVSRRALAGGGIDRIVQRALAELRTDLDSFSDDEACALMAIGYLMTKHDLAAALPEHAQAPPRGDWPFAGTLAVMTSNDASRLAESLRLGHHMLFRGPRAWMHRLGTLASRLHLPARTHRT